MNRSVLCLFTLLFFISQNISAQDKYADAYVCTKGKTHFYASTPLEDIEATSNSTICVLNSKSKKVFAKVGMTSCTFRDGLMQEHFNENYMESTKFPYGTLDAEIAENIDFTKDGVYDITIKGTFEIHGVKKEREIKGKLTIKNGQPVNATAVFDVKLADHGIKIPTAVVAKIAEVVKVDVDFNFEKFKK
jgi:polyisoprenoid-binding protein YceI